MRKISLVIAIFVGALVGIATQDPALILGSTLTGYVSMLGAWQLARDLEDWCEKHEER